MQWQTGQKQYLVCRGASGEQATADQDFGGLDLQLASGTSCFSQAPTELMFRALNL